MMFDLPPCDDDDASWSQTYLQSCTLRPEKIIALLKTVFIYSPDIINVPYGRGDLCIVQVIAGLIALGHKVVVP